MWSCDQSLVTLAFLWEKLSIPQFYKDLTRKTAFLEGWSWFNNYGLALGADLKFHTSVAKGLELKVRKFRRLIYTFAEVTEEKLVGEGGLCAPPPPSSWIGLRKYLYRIKRVSDIVRVKIKVKILVGRTSCF